MITLDRRTCALLLTLAVPALAAGAHAIGAGESVMETVASSCSTDNPYFAASRVAAPGGDDGPALVGFYDTLNDDLRQQLPLAPWRDAGPTYGLAYDWRRGHLYAAAYHRNGEPFGPGGPGAVYKLDLRTGELVVIAQLDAGPDRHLAGDDASGGWVGRSALGDIEVDSSGNQLLVVNLADRRIYRLRVPDGLPLGSFEHGGAAQPWAERARPFGLVTHDGWVFHGVVELAAVGADTAPMAHVFRSRPDGTQMTEVARFGLGYARAPSWGPWTEDGDGPLAEPMLVEVVLRPGGAPIVGLRDRRSDAAGVTGGGDVLPMVQDGGAWVPEVDPERFGDRFVVDESLLGAAASFPGIDLFVAAATAPLSPGTSGAVWYDAASGTAVARETVSLGAPAGSDAAGALGDVESLCGPPGAPTLAPTPKPTSTPTPTPTPEPAYLPFALLERCPPRPVDLVLVLDLSTSMRERTQDNVQKLAAASAAARALLDLLDLEGGSSDRAAIVGFNDHAEVLRGLSGDRGVLEAGLADLEGRLAAGSRIDLGLGTASQLLSGESSPDRPAAVVLISDGIPNAVPVAEDGSAATTVLRVAQSVREAGSYLFAIGFGRAAEIDRQLLTKVAGDAWRYLEAPTAVELSAVLERLATMVRCPPGRHPWGVAWP